VKTDAILRTENIIANDSIRNCTPLMGLWFKKELERNSSAEEWRAKYKDPL
jgi:hypothetical protein